MAWLRANNVDFSGKRKHATEKAIEDHFGEKGRAAE
jgi:hypothetical protein